MRRIEEIRRPRFGHLSRAGKQSRTWLPLVRLSAGKGEAAKALTVPHTYAAGYAPGPGRKDDVSTGCRPFPVSCLAQLFLLLSACATQSATGIAPAAPGFLHGLWHGFIFPFAWLLSLFMPEVAVYSVPNNGGWYDFGYFLGIAVFGVGARKSHVVYRDRVVVREARP